jgi:hypothetical protein
VWIEAWCDLVRRWKPLEWGEETGQILSGVGPFLQRRAVEREAYTFRRQFVIRRANLTPVWSAPSEADSVTASN